MAHEVKTVFLQLETDVCANHGMQEEEEEEDKAEEYMEDEKVPVDT